MSSSGDLAPDVGQLHDRRGSTNFDLDNVVVYDTVYTDRKIPSETVYDADGRVVASVLPPGDLASERPMTTITTYDPASRPTSITVNADPTQAGSTKGPHWLRPRSTATSMPRPTRPRSRIRADTWDARLARSASQRKRYRDRQVRNRALGDATLGEGDQRRRHCRDQATSAS
jgi:YD repeat-containing protein